MTDWQHDLASITPFADVDYSGRFDEAFCDRWMNVGDPLSDQVIDAVRSDGYRGAAGVGDQLSKVAALARSEGGMFADLYEQTRTLPPWVNTDMIVEGQRLVTNTHPFYGMSLFHSLFAGAAFVRAALVTGSTGRLGGDPRRRITETSAMIFALAADGGHLPDSDGHNIVVKVRLLHSSIRYWITQNDIAKPSWAGVPIDQTMLAITSSLFSYLNIRSLLRLGVSLSRDQVDAHHHLWRYVGWLLGIDEALLTDSIEEERDLWHAVARHQAFPELLGGEAYVRFVSAQAGRLAPDRRGAAVARRVFGDLHRHLSAPDWYGAADAGRPEFGLDAGPGSTSTGWPVRALQAAAVPSSLADRFVPGVGTLKRRRVLVGYDRAMRSLRNHDYDVSTEDGADDDGGFTAAAEATLAARFGVNA